MARIRRKTGILGRENVHRIVLALLLAAPNLAQGGDTARDRSSWSLADDGSSQAGRRRVRGGRPPGASIHVPWAPAPHRPDRAQQLALATFERAAFPPGIVAQTIIAEPKEAWMKALRKPDLPVRWNRKTIEYLEYFRNDDRGQALMRAWIRRAGRYEASLRKILRDVGVPEDLVMVALAESGFNPTVRSRVGAAGLWQFMEGTGAVYGLRRNYWVDERFDIERSTRAAARYLKDLRVRFGSWELALAAYNAGYGLVMTTIGRHNTNNFWSLCEIESGLPYATTNYVPKIIAAALVFRNREVFGVGPDKVQPDPRIDWVAVQVGQSTSLDALAKAIDVEPATLRELNAQLIRRRTPPRRGRYRVKIPRDKTDAFTAAQPRLRAVWRGETTHEVTRGETLATIARRYGTDVRSVRRLNGVKDSAELVGGVHLVVPAEPIPGADVPPPPQKPLAAVPKVAVDQHSRLLFFVTTRATTPKTLAKTFDVRLADIVRWNDLDPQARIQSDQVLQIVVPKTFDARNAGVIAYERTQVEHVIRGSAEHLEAALARRGKVRRGYRIKKGDTLRKIGRRFGLTVGDLARINGFSRQHPLTAGQLVVVYVEQNRTRGTLSPPTPGYDAKARKARRKPSTATTNRVPTKKRGDRTLPGATAP